MGVEYVRMHRPLWLCKVKDDKLKEYMEALDDFKLRGHTDNELLLDTAEGWYDDTESGKALDKLADDVYREAAIRWYGLKYDEMKK